MDDVHALRFLSAQQQIVSSGAGAQDVDSRENPLLGQLPVQHELHVARTLELLVNHVVHTASGVHQSRGQDGQASALPHIAGSAEETLGHIQGRRVKTAKGAQIGIAGLVAAVDVATANNTVAIVMTGSIAKDISEEYNIDPRRTASLLDIFASVMQGILPYGAQLLYAAAGAGVSAMQIVPYMFYCYLMAVSAILFIVFFAKKFVISK